jgi:hypothetical protein
MSLTPEIPTPKRLLKEAKTEELQHPYDLTDYGEVIDVLFRKGFSYAKIAKWLSVRLEGPVKRGQIYYVYQNLLKSRRAAESLAASSSLVDDERSSGPENGEADDFDPELAKFLNESQEAQLDAQADKEDSKRKRKRRKSP